MIRLALVAELLTPVAHLGDRIWVEVRYDEPRTITVDYLHDPLRTGCPGLTVRGEDGSQMYSAPPLAYPPGSNPNGFDPNATDYAVNALRVDLTACAWLPPGRYTLETEGAEPQPFEVLGVSSAEAAARIEAQEVGPWFAHPPYLPMLEAALVAHPDREPLLEAIAACRCAEATAVLMRVHEATQHEVLQHRIRQHLRYRVAPKNQATPMWWPELGEAVRALALRLWLRLRTGGATRDDAAFIEAVRARIGELDYPTPEGGAATSSSPSPGAP